MRISVYITSYNQKHYLIEAIESVLAQTLKPFQIIIVDDCSTDGSQELIAGFHSQHPGLITPLYHARNTGVTQARIDALQAVTGDYVTYVDGDDRFLPTKLEQEANLLQVNPHAEIAFSNNFYMKTDGTHLWVWAEGTKPPVGSVFLQTFARDFPRRSLFRMELVNYHAWKRIGFHDPNLHMYEDYDMRIRLTKCLQAVYCDEPLAEIRYHFTGLSSSKLGRHFQALDYIYRKNQWLLNDLSETERNYVDRKFGRWIANIAVGAAVESFKDRQHTQAAELLVAAVRYDPTIFNWTLLMRAIRKGAILLKRACVRVNKRAKNVTKLEET